MKFQYKKSMGALRSGTTCIYIFKSTFKAIKDLGNAENSYLKKQFQDNKGAIAHCDQNGQHVFALIANNSLKGHAQLEDLRVRCASLCKTINSLKVSTAILEAENTNHLLTVAEGLALSNYQFLKYFKDAKKRENTLKSIQCVSKKNLSKQLKEIEISCRAVYVARDLVNEPVSYLNAPQLGKEVKALSKEFGFKAEVWGKAKIKSMKMGGVLAVNQGSLDEPSFSTLTWKPSKAINKQPIILVGKGVVYDTGGLSLKPTANSMDMMKSDMGGAASVIGAMCAIAANQLPIYVVALVPSTDNRPGGNAYAPGDVVTMFDGSTVEVLNTDAEGRMLLADALAYAKKYQPELVIDAATLTGSAARAVGRHAIVGMSNADKKQMTQLMDCGLATGEPVVEFPFWDVYADDLKSNIADQKNLGGPEAGAITAGKFLEKFTDYPYIHLDIAGPAYTTSPFNYRGTGGTGVGVRLLLEFVKRRAEK